MYPGRREMIEYSSNTRFAKDLRAIGFQDLRVPSLDIRKKEALLVREEWDRA
jgi:hypothetical protein